MHFAVQIDLFENLSTVGFKPAVEIVQGDFGEVS